MIIIATLLCLPFEQRHGSGSQEEKASCGESGVDLTWKAKAAKSNKCGKASHAERDVLCERPPNVIWCDRLDRAYRDIPESLES